MQPFTPVEGRTIVTNAGLGMGKSMNGQAVFRELLNHPTKKHVVISLTSRVVQCHDERARFLEDFSSKGSERFRTDPLLAGGMGAPGAFQYLRNRSTAMLTNGNTPAARQRTIPELLAGEQKSDGGGGDQTGVVPADPKYAVYDKYQLDTYMHGQKRCRRTDDDGGGGDDDDNKDNSDRDMTYVDFIISHGSSMVIAMTYETLGRFNAQQLIDSNIPFSINMDEVYLATEKYGSETTAHMWYKGEKNLRLLYTHAHVVIASSADIGSDVFDVDNAFETAESELVRVILFCCCSCIVFFAP
jgi:hypothetical protein